MVDNNYHRLDGRPAFIGADGTQEWWVDNKCHRLDGRPAVIRADGSRSWYVDGKRHRLDGPAVIYPDGSQQWWVDGKDISDQVKKWMKECDITYPFDKEYEVLFVIKFA